MQNCSVCQKPTELDDFPWRNKAKGLKQKYCKQCNRNNRVAHYQANKADYRRRARIADPKRLATLRDYTKQYLASHPCVDCGEKDIVVLQFDHIHGIKRDNVSDLIIGRVGLNTLMEEIAKCEVRCANCHLRKTAIQFNW